MLLVGTQNSISTERMLLNDSGKESLMALRVVQPDDRGSSCCFVLILSLLKVLVLEKPQSRHQLVVHHGGRTHWRIERLWLLN